MFKKPGLAREETYQIGDSDQTRPIPDSSKTSRSRISLTTNPATTEKRVSKKPRVTNIQVQTDYTPEYGTLADHLYYERVSILMGVS